MRNWSVFLCFQSSNFMERYNHLNYDNLNINFFLLTYRPCAVRITIHWIDDEHRFVHLRPWFEDNKGNQGDAKDTQILYRHHFLSTNCRCSSTVDYSFSSNAFLIFFFFNCFTIQFDYQSLNTHIEVAADKWITYIMFYQNESNAIYNIMMFSMND